jgi:hypothetical protein
MLGPIGSAIGGIAGGAAGYFGGDDEPEDTGPKRKRMTFGLEQMQQGRQRREAAMASLSQAVFDWANSLR